jgi:hypothetical protein
LINGAVIKTSDWRYLVMAVLSLVRLASAALPEPPAQHQLWTPPDVRGIPEYVVTVAGKLFDSGLADPRGGEYREIEFAIPLAYFPEAHDRLQTHAWVFSNQYAVCWNGLVYQALTVGPRADLDRDVRTIAATQPWSGRFPFRKERIATRVAFWFNMEGPGALAPLSIALLVRLGRSDLARQLWQAPESRAPFDIVSQHEPDAPQLFESAVHSWLGGAYWRLISARERDDDQEAIDIADSLTVWEKHALEAWKQLASLGHGTFPDTSFLKPVPALLADSRRRLGDPQRPKIDLRGLAEDRKSADHESSAFLKRPQAERIADLVERLEDVRGEKVVIPGKLEYSLDPVCELLTQEGEAAVEPLLDAYEHDQRLTRNVDYGRPWYTERGPVPVSVVAKSVLSEILNVPVFVEGASPAELRDWWAKHKNGDRLIRSFELLADDRATPEEWLQSADIITLRSDIKRSGAMTTIAPEDCSPDKPIPKPFGESLRIHQNPSVSELLVKRTAWLALSDTPDTCRMAFMAYLWDPATVPGLHLARNLEACRGDGLVTAARMTVGDSHAAAEWAALIRKRVFKPAFQISELAPLWMFPDDAVMQQTADWFFNQPNSPLAPSVEPDEVDSPLLTLRAYRKAVRAALNDDSVAGTATRSQEGMLSIATKIGGMESLEPGTDARQVPPGQERPVRVKDLVAWQLSRLKGAPDFQPDWPEADKDGAIPELAGFLETHESELRAFPAKPGDTVCLNEYVYLSH